VDAIYKKRQGDFSRLPKWSAQTGIVEPPQSHLFGEASTVEIEKQLALT
jgi:hypothetical protein